MSDRLRVLQVLEATEGGTRRHLLYLLERLPRDRFDLAAAVSLRRGARVFARDAERLRAAGVRVHEVPMRRRIAPLADYVSLSKLRAVIAREKPDVVHTHASKAGFLGRAAARLARVERVVHTGHVFAFQWATGAKRRRYLALERFAARWADALVCVGPAQHRTAIEAGLPAAKLVTIPNGVDAARFESLAAPEARARVRAELGLAGDARVVGTVARLAPQKGCGHLMRAARTVLERDPKAIFLLVGSGALEAKLCAEADALGLGERFRFLGERPDAERLYAAMDLFVMPSLWEGLPYAVLEAQASGLAVVASRIPGLVDLVSDGETGRLIELGDEKGLAGAILELLEDRALAARMGAAGRERVRTEFRLDRFIERHAALYAGETSRAELPLLAAEASRAL